MFRCEQVTDGGTENERFSAQSDRRPSAVSRAVAAEEDGTAGCREEKWRES